MTASRPSSSLTSSSASTLSPPFLANAAAEESCAESRRRRSCCNALSRAGAPGFELLPDLLGFAVARHDDVHMVRAAIDGVESPPPHPAMIANGQFDEPGWSWSRRQASSLRRACACVCERDRQVANRGGLDPPRSSPGSQVHTLARSENRTRVRAKAVRNHAPSAFHPCVARLVHPCPLE